MKTIKAILGMTKNVFMIAALSLAISLYVGGYRVVKKPVYEIEQLTPDEILSFTHSIIMNNIDEPKRIIDSLVNVFDDSIDKTLIHTFRGTVYNRTIIK